jgi:hypothetical protein
MVTVWEEDRDEQFADGAVTITRTFGVEPYSERGTVIDALMGGIAEYGGQLVRTLPARDPWFPWCWCVDVKSKLFDVLNTPGGATGLNQLTRKNYAQRGRLVATYKSLDRDPAAAGKNAGSPSNTEQQEKELASESWDYGSKSLTLPNQFWKWPDDKTLNRTETGVAKILPQIEFTLVRHFVARKPHKAITTMVGHVNKSKFGAWPPETLRFDGLHAERKVMSKGRPYWDLTYKFAVFPLVDLIGGVPLDPSDPNYVSGGVGGAEPNTMAYIGWNRLYRPDLALWMYPVATGNGVAVLQRRIYPSDEDVPNQTIRGRVIKGFNQLFHPRAE